MLRITLSGRLSSTCSSVKVNRECEREEEAFILWVPMILFLRPRWNRSRTCS